MFNGILKLLKREPEGSTSHVNEKLAYLEEVLDIKIEDTQTYMRALRHRSILDSEPRYDSDESYERLEFLGDAVLDLIVSEIIYERFPDKNEGFMTKMRAQIVKGDALANYATELGLGTVLEVGGRAREQGIEFSKSILADVFESVIGALYLTKGYQQTFEFVAKVIEELVKFDEITGSLDNYKSILLEYSQARQWSIPEYFVLTEYGPGHDKTFEIEVRIGDESMGKGVGKSKKEGEQQAARDAMSQLEESEDAGS
jgi:ribonuclease-3